MVLAGRDRGHGNRVLGAVGAGLRRLARAGVDDVVRRREGEYRARLRPRLGAAHAGGGGGRPARRERGPARVDVRGALAEGDALRRGARLARRRAGRPRRDLHADGAGDCGRLACVRAHRRRAGSDLLRLRRACDRAAAAGRRGEGAADGEPLLPAWARNADARDRRRGRGRVAVGRARRRVGPRDAACGTSSSGRASCRRSRSTRSIRIS